MNFPKSDLYSQLEDIHRRPEPFSVYTAETLWTDPHIARQMLAFHLDPGSEPASRPHAFLDRSAEWIARRFDLARGATVADYGCGPGLYAQRFAAAGARVTGIDFSANSIAHARAEADRFGLDIEYVEANYLDHEPRRKTDLITLIYCDLCALSPSQRAQLLRRFADSLADGGFVLLDVFALPAFAGRAESSEHACKLMGGFWAAGDYWGFRDTFKYEDEKVVLDKYVIVEPERTRTVHNWLQYFTFPKLEAEFAAAGLQIVEKYGDVAGAPFDPDGDVMAVVAQKR